jgi:RNA polymerase sigma factor (sigma-70 family)
MAFHCTRAGAIVSSLPDPNDLVASRNRHMKSAARAVNDSVARAGCRVDSNPLPECAVPNPYRGCRWSRPSNGLIFSPHHGENTVRGSSSVSHFLRQISSGPRPERTDEHESVARARNGDREAIDRLMSSHLAYIVRIAMDFRGRGVPFEDLIAEGCVGLLKAIRGYRGESGNRFMTYASFWVRKEILAAVAEQPHAIHVPDYARRHGHAAIRPLRLDAPGNADDDLRLADRLRHPDPLPAETMLETEQTLEVRRHLLRLAPRERIVIACRYGLDGQPAQTLMEVARRLGVSRERVRQIEVAALKTLREHIEGRDRLSGNRNPRGRACRTLRSSERFLVART